MPTRRTAIATIATGATIGLAGCGSSANENNFELSIYNNEGNSIPNANVEISNNDPFESNELIKSTETDDSGLVTADLEEGEYIISVSHQDYLSKNIEIEIEDEKYTKEVTLEDYDLATDARRQVEDFLLDYAGQEATEVNANVNEEEELIVIAKATEPGNWDWPYYENVAEIVESIFELEIEIDYLEFTMLTETGWPSGSELKQENPYNESIFVGISDETADDIIFTMEEIKENAEEFDAQIGTLQ